MHAMSDVSHYAHVNLLGLSSCAKPSSGQVRELHSYYLMEQVPSINVTT